MTVEDASVKLLDLLELEDEDGINIKDKQYIELFSKLQLGEDEDYENSEN